MRIKLLKGWNGQSAGAVIEPPIDAVAKTLILRGFAVEVEANGKAKRPQIKLQDWVKKTETQ